MSFDDKKFVAQNPTTPPEKLQRLLESTLEESQEIINWYKSTSRTRPPLTLISQLEVLSYIANNSNTPPDTLDFLARFNAIFRDEVNNLSSDADWESVWSSGHEEELSVNKSWSGWHDLYSGYIFSIHRAVASNPSTPPELLSLLSKDSNPDVRAAVAKNRNTPSDVLTQLKMDEVEWVRNSMSSEEYMREKAIVYRKEKYWKDFWEVFPWSGGILGAICGLVGCAIGQGSFGGAFGGMLVGTILGGLWALIPKDD